MEPFIPPVHAPKAQDPTPTTGIPINVDRSSNRYPIVKLTKEESKPADHPVGSDPDVYDSHPQLLPGNAPKTQEPQMPATEPTGTGDGEPTRLLTVQLAEEEKPPENHPVGSRDEVYQTHSRPPPTQIPEHPDRTPLADEENVTDMNAQDSDSPIPGHNSGHDDPGESSVKTHRPLSGDPTGQHYPHPHPSPFPEPGEIKPRLGLFRVWILSHTIWAS
ncbi:hypothetical protein B0T16DRAFT_459001 [Cercophora newfieldiana]|uniref:Uncharacterized protein n=1 Tax=Cercophora newfieldiana TaxID=92897 RepID=A0AA39Y8U4_9PEZI|nr:hypothetical protein B0T16DRAFT_459001 [Cercophora newfieldiana]